MNFRATGKGVAGFRMLLSILGCSAAVLATVCFTPPGADGVIFRPDQHKDNFRQRTGVFEVTVRGMQFNKWQLSRNPSWECDVSAKGSGWERSWFHAPPRRMRIRAFGEGKADSAIFKQLPVRGKVIRKGKIKRGSPATLPEHCLADGGDGPPPKPPAPDCGTKRIRGAKFAPVALNGKLTLDVRAVGQRFPDLFKRCDYIGRVWPGLLTRRGNGSSIQAAFGPKRVYNRTLNRRTGKKGKVVLKARGQAVNRGFGSWYKTTVRWTIVMKRIR